MQLEACYTSAHYTIPSLQCRKGILEVNEAAKRIHEYSQASRAREEEERRLAALAKRRARTPRSASSEQSSVVSSDDCRENGTCSRSASPTSSGRLSPTMSAHWSSVSDTPPREASPDFHALALAPGLYITSTQAQQPFNGFVHAALAVAHGRSSRPMPIGLPSPAPPPVVAPPPAAVPPVSSPHVLSAEELYFRQRWIDMHFSSQRVPVFHRSPPREVVADELASIEHLSLSDSDDGQALDSAPTSSSERAGNEDVLT